MSLNRKHVHAAASQSEASGLAHEPTEQTYDRCADALYRFAVVRLGGDTHLADDLMQSLWLKAQAHRQRLSPDHAEAWLRTVLRNLVREHFRREGRQQELQRDRETALRCLHALETRELPQDAIDDRELHEHLLHAITELSALDQELLIGRFFHGHTLAELAQMHATTERAIEGRLYRARQRLREALRDHQEDC